MKVNPLVYILLAVVLLGGLFFVFKPKTQPVVNNLDTTSEPTVSPSTQDRVKTFELVVKDNKLASGQSTLSVKVGDDVVIKIVSDVNGEFHLHGYDKSVNLEKDASVELKFNANLSGRFPFELEDTKTELGALEVSPQ